MKQLLIQGVEKVDSNMWKNFIKHVVGKEERFWQMEFTVDELMAEREPCIINIEPDDSDDSDDLDDITPLSDS